jgi:hypothetical protein
MLARQSFLPVDFKANIVDFDALRIIVIRLLDHCQSSIPMLNNVYGATIMVLNEMRVHITLKKTVCVIDCQSKIINANIAEVQVKDDVFSLLTILNLLTGLL